MQRTICLAIASSLGAATWAYGQGGDPKGLLQEKLKAQFALTTMTADRSDIVTAGAVLVLQKNGLMMYSTASPMPPANNYKNGRISQGGSGFGRDLAISMMTPGNATASVYPHRQFVAGEGVWVTGFNLRKDGVVFQLYSDAYDGIRYYGELKFPFQKNAFPAPEDALATIAEVLTVKPAENTAPAAAAPAPPAPEAAPPPLAIPEAPATAAPGAPLLRNDDVIKMAKAGFDDSIIIAKISSSRCHFDTSTDALIQLKQNGVSSAVIKAIVGAAY
jgi:hypothetical protein